MAGLKCPPCGGRQCRVVDARRDTRGRIIAVEAVCDGCGNAWRSRSRWAILALNADELDRLSTRRDGRC